MELVRLDRENYSLVQQIYADGLATGVATFETEVPSWEKWDSSHLKCARIGAVEEGIMLGWAALSPVSGRCVYGGVAEVSVYVAKNAQRKGVGRYLLNSLIKISEDEGIWTLQSGIMPQNLASVMLHEKCGFRRIGYREKVAKLGGVWTDNVLFEKRSKVVGV
jgi:phosphinothricin acetyltransferase